MEHFQPLLFTLERNGYLTPCDIKVKILEVKYKQREIYK